MNVIKKMKQTELHEFAQIFVNAYPGRGYTEDHINGTKKWFSDVVDQEPEQQLFGAYRDGQLVGGMILYTMKMNLISHSIQTGGIGAVAVDLLHKKEKVSLDLFRYAFKSFLEEGIHFISLYPFDIGFYRKLGFGYGGQMKQYQVKPTHFPKGSSKEHIYFLQREKDHDEVLRCYTQFYGRTNGMIERHDVEDLFDANERRIIGYKKSGKVLGYLVFSYERKYDYVCNLVIQEIVYENAEVLLELCTYLHSQSDQFESIKVDTQDEYFHYLLSNPTRGTSDAFGSLYLETTTTGEGIMYRVTDITGIFQDLRDHNFGDQTCKCKLSVQDDLIESNNASVIIHFTNGFAQIVENEDYEVEIGMNVGEFSSLLMGAIDFKSLVRYGLATLSDCHYENTIQRIFRTDQKPMCFTSF
ncbi:hypothetical protein C2W64_02098 [Brevibacillus laterosporus]|nr:GNAT family N-acetyltransferase [Brevibacillus laterosporus]RAP26082.1 hypothetical protein C2W64_02098 [Brevibacillus laterosporus]